MKFTLQWLGALFILFSTSSCQAIQDARRDRWDKIRLAAFKSGVCPLHHVRLQGTAVYCWSHSETEPSDPRPADPFFMREDKYPMRLSVYKRLTASRDFHDRCVYTFCPICQQLFDADLRHFSSNQSMKPTQHFVVSSRPMCTLIVKVLGGLSLSC